MSELDKSINRLEEMKTIEDKREQYRAVVRINGIKKEFVIDTGSPVTIMPPDEQIIGKTEIKKITNLYQDVNRNQVKFRKK